MPRESPAPEISLSPDATDATASPGLDESMASPSADETAAPPVVAESPDAAGASGNTQRDILPNARGEDVTHLTIKSVKLTASPDRCEFAFVQNLYAVTL
jgi:hypothetical protein